jgi:hypothetical protein
MDSFRKVTATFAPSMSLLTVAVAGGGSVSSDPSGISCGEDCSESYVGGTAVTLTATPDAGYHFGGWGGGYCTGMAECEIPMTRDWEVTAAFAPAPERSFPLNDTGITTCSAGDVNGLSCEAAPAAQGAAEDVSAYPGQDGEYGRDVIYNDDSDGRAGFSFTKLGADGHPLAIQDGAWSDAGSEAAGTLWTCVRDEVTHLTWEVKVNDVASLHHKGHTYTWYNPDTSTNGGDAGTPGGGSCNGTLPVSGDYTGCDTYTFPTYVNEHGGLCGFTDWRLPSLRALRSILDYSVPQPGPTIDTGFFPNNGDEFWSASPSVGYGAPAWCISFVFHLSGDAHQCGKAASIPVRLVRGGQ